MSFEKHFLLMNNMLLELNIFCCAIFEVRFITIYNEEGLLSTQLSPSKTPLLDFSS